MKSTWVENNRETSMELFKYLDRNKGVSKRNIVDFLVRNYIVSYNASARNLVDELEQRGYIYRCNITSVRKPKCKSEIIGFKDETENKFYICEPIKKIIANHSAYHPNGFIRTLKTLLIGLGIMTRNKPISGVSSM